jgi:hypothetical protein
LAASLVKNDGSFFLPFFVCGLGGRFTFDGSHDIPVPLLNMAQSVGERNANDHLDV